MIEINKSSILERILLFNTKRALKIILLFALINSSIFIAFTPSQELRLIIAALMNLSAILLVVYFFKISVSNIGVNLYYKIVFSLLIIWCVFTFARGATFTTKGIISLFGHYLMGWAWITPLAFVFGLRISNWLGVFDFLAKILLVGIVLSIISFLSEDIAIALLEWVVFFPILLMTFNFQNKKNQAVVVGSVLSFLLLSYFASQRANVIFLFLFFFFMSLEFFRENRMSLISKVALLLVGFATFLLLLLQLESMLAKALDSKVLTSDTRTFLFVELFADMSTKELVYGRGSSGTYYSPFFARMISEGREGGDWMYRQVNEVGYLHMILKGGIVMVGLHLLIMVPAAFHGIFRGDNIIARMSGYYILAYLVLWMVTYYSVYSAEYVLLWMAVGTSISKSARNLKNSEITIKTENGYIFAKPN